MTTETDQTPEGPDGPAGPETDSPGDLRVVVGLGNPGPRYDGTRHNVGFDVVRCLAERLGDGVERQAWRSFVWETALGPTPLRLLLPQTYMNLSGRAVRACAEAGDTPPRRVLVVCDDLHLPLAKIRLRRKGSSGGHKGLISIADALGTEGFPRLRLGIGEPGEEDAEEFVLDRFEGAERDAIGPAVTRAAEAIETWITEGIEEAMSRYNG